MLVISRQEGEELLLFDSKVNSLIASVMFCGWKGSKAKIGIKAPQSLKVIRGELSGIKNPLGRRLMLDVEENIWVCLDANGKCLWSETDEESARIRFSIEKDGFNV